MFGFFKRPAAPAPVVFSDLSPEAAEVAMNAIRQSLDHMVKQEEQLRHEAKGYHDRASLAENTARDLRRLGHRTTDEANRLAEKRAALAETLKIEDR
jgi:hypothetical protein